MRVSMNYAQEMQVALEHWKKSNRDGPCKKVESRDIEFEPTHRQKVEACEKSVTRFPFVLRYY